MPKALPIVTLTFTLFSATAAQAFCYQSSGYDFASSVNGALDYLICLHNQQGDSLNDQARIINSHADSINNTSRAVELVRSAVVEMQSRISDQEYEIEQLRRAVRDMESRLSLLE